MNKIFLAFVKKEFYHILRDTRTLIILFGMPIALVLIFGYTVSNEFKGASMAVYDEAKDELSKELVEHITASGHFKLFELSDNIEDIDAAFKAGSIKLGIVIPPGFEKSFYKEKNAAVQILADATEPNNAVTLTSYATRMINSFQMSKAKTARMPYQIRIETRMFYNPKLVGAYTFVPGVVALILMLTCAMMTSLTIVKEKEMGTMDLLLVSPLQPMLIIIGKVTPYTVLSFLSALVVFAMGYIIFDVPILGSLPLLLVLTLLYIVVSLALGVLISTSTETQQNAMMTSMFSLLLPTMLFSGFIFPIESMPTALQYFCDILPAKYFIIIEKAIMLKGAGWSSIYQPALVLVFMLIVLMVAAWKKFEVIYK
ncbi:MAG: ABC transporter permease [Melioribacteraceae bacterium]